MTYSYRTNELVIKASEMIHSAVLKELSTLRPDMIDLKTILRAFKDVSSKEYWKEKGRNY